MAVLMVLVFAEELWWSSWDCPFVWMAIVQPVRLCVHLPAPALHTISSGCWKSQHSRWATITKARHSFHRSAATLNHLPTVIYIFPSCILLPSVSPDNDALAPRHPQIFKKENQMHKPLPSISPCSSLGALNMESALCLTFPHKAMCVRGLLSSDTFSAVCAAVCGTTQANLHSRAHLGMFGTHGTDTSSSTVLPGITCDRHFKRLENFLRFFLSNMKTYQLFSKYGKNLLNHL